MGTRILLALMVVVAWRGSAGALPAETEGGTPGSQVLACLESATSTLSANPTAAKLGESVTLSWSVSGMPSNCASIKFSLDGQSVGSTGTRTEKALATHTYVLRATFSGGEATSLRREATVEVQLPPLVDVTGSTGRWRDLLVQAVGTPNTTVRLADGVDMDLSGHENVSIASGVTITSERNPPKKGLRPAALAAAASSAIVSADVSDGARAGSPPTAGRTPRSLGPRIYTKTRPRPLFHIACGSPKPPANVRLYGFRIQGPHFETMEGNDNLERGLMISICHGVEIANMEFSGWSGQAIYVHDQPKDENGNELPPDPTTGPQVVRIHDSFFHHNQHEGGNGYGIDVAKGGYASIEQNVFDFNRHAIAASGKPGVSYDAVRNLVLRGGGVHGKWYNSQTHLFDVHGDANCPDIPGNRHTWNCGNAGDQFRIDSNAFQYVKDHAIKLRGKPRIQAYIANNVFAHDDDDTAIALRTKTNVILKNNRKEIDTFGQYGVCDFDGDGGDDLFLPTGVTWWFASRAKMHWVYLNAATERLRDVGLGDFDGDRRCDVFAVNTSNKQWEISSGGTGAWKPVGNFGIPFAELAFADFDGDGATDVFRRASNGQWTIYSIKKNTHHAAQSSSFPLKDLRFGDFDGDKKADVLAVQGGSWAYSKGAMEGWQPLNKKLKDKMAGILIGDVDGNGKDDVLRLKPSLPALKWEISWDARSEWKPLTKVANPAPALPRPPRFFAFIGRFDESKGSDPLTVDDLVRRGQLYSHAAKKVSVYSLYAY